MDPNTESWHARWGLSRANTQFPSRFQMAGFHHPLRLGTVIWFGSLEFMSLGIEYDMVLLPPGPMADTQERPSVCSRPSRRRRQRRSNCNCATHGTRCPDEALGLADDAHSLARDLANVSVMPRASSATCHPQQQLC
jgi:hypothetical protein